MNRVIAVSHGDVVYPFVEPEPSSPKQGSAVKVLGDYMICKDLDNSPDENICGSVRAGGDTVMREIRVIEI